MNLQHAQLALLAALALLALCTCDPARPIDERGLDGADACYQGKLAYCLDELGLGEEDCALKAAAWCERGDDPGDAREGACLQGKLAYCLDELGLDEATCERKAAAWCGGDEERSDD